MSRFGNSSFVGVVFMLMATMLFAIKPILVRMALEEGITPTDMVSLRLMVAFPLFFITAMLIGSFKGAGLTGRQVLSIAAVAIFGMSGAMLFSFYSIKYLGASISTLVIFIFPAITTLMTMLFFGEAVSRVRLLSLAVSFMGIAMVAVPTMNGEVSLQWFNPQLGLLFAFGCAVCWAGASVGIQKVAQGVSPIMVSLLACGFMLLIFLLFNGLPNFEVTRRGFWVVFMLGSLVWYLPFLLSVYAIKMIGASSSSIIQSLGPGITVFLASALLGEQLQPAQFGGMVALIVAVILLKQDGVKGKEVISELEEAKQKVEAG